MARKKKRKYKGQMVEFLHEKGRLRLESKSKDELIEMIVKTNARRKQEVAKWHRLAKMYRTDFIRERDAQARTCANFRKYMDDMEQRERTMTDHDAFYKEWKNNVDELAQKEGKRLAYVEHIKRCNECNGRTWHKRYQLKVKGFQEYVTQMLKFVNDVLRDPSIPDIEKARMVDMRNSLIDSRDLLAKELDDKSHLPDEWLGSTEK